MKKVLFVFMSFMFIMCLAGCKDENQVTNNSKDKFIENSVINKNLEDYLNEYELNGPVKISKVTACKLKIQSIQLKINNCFSFGLDGNKIENYENYNTNDLIEDIEFLLIVNREINAGAIKVEDIKLDDIDSLLFQLKKIYYGR